jgi:hypothetical protein
VASGAETEFDVSTVNRGPSTTTSIDPNTRLDWVATRIDAGKATIAVTKRVFNSFAMLAVLAVVDDCSHLNSLRQIDNATSIY